jgi:hypothetical protein
LDLVGLISDFGTRIRPRIALSNAGIFEGSGSVAVFVFVFAIGFLGFPIVGTPYHNSIPSPIKVVSMNEIPSTEFSLVEPFDIDDGSLNSVSAAECFAMGVEWQIFRNRLASGKPFTDLVLANNAVRLTKLAERSQRFVETRPANQGWVSITVGDQLV